MIAAFFAQLAVLYAPPLQWVFRTVPLTAPEWLGRMCSLGGCPRRATSRNDGTLDSGVRRNDADLAVVDSCVFPRHPSR